MDADVAAHPFLIGLDEHHVRLLADCAVRVTFEADQIVFREGETANRFYLIERGEVVLESTTPTGEAIAIDRIGDGDLLGWSWLFAPHVWRFTARAVQPTTAIFFYGTVLREYCEKDHSLGYELLKRMSEVMTRRLQSARGKLLEKSAASGPKLI
ncbi:MAG: cyclic nucleotide-binding domain-containing protein [Chthoniobacterales bacterium]